MRERQTQEILAVLLDDCQQCVIVADVGGRAMDKLRIAQHVDKQMPLDAVGRFVPAITFGLSVRRVSVFGAHRIAD